jgi:rare lipoprotein A
MKKIILLRYILLFFCLIFCFSGFSQSKKNTAPKSENKPAVKVAPQIAIVDTILKIVPANDSIRMLGSMKLKLFKKNAHASYYADKFTGRRTASGKKFDNTKYTCAHRKFPFGTKLKVTCERNNKSTIVEVTDRGPFVRGRDIDLSKKAFMDIAPSTYGGSLAVTIEIIK